ncbi:hypothetical protein E2C01_049244 [Portunus trituberculatus]|uniref:Uncharacterized protein n=1 Tax=Portunus trituberculatus TaxID=210409 RepID=A0A5B7GDF0_PORTR|nr:hypothetical protein [Portunus trituberculatus]
MCLKFCGPIPERMAIGNMVYHVRHHTLPVMRCLLFDHGNISCNEHAQCRKCSGFHNTDGHIRTLISVPTPTPNPTPFHAPIPALFLNPTPVPIKPLSPIIDVVPLTSQPPIPKAQWTHCHHKPNLMATP